MNTLRPTLRSLAKNRTFTLAAVLTLGLGMGAAASIFTLLQRVVLDPLPYPHADRLVRLKNPVPGVGANEEWELSTAQYFYFSQHARTLDAVGLYSSFGASFTSAAPGSEPRRVRSSRVTWQMLDMLGARAIRGRLLTKSDDVPGAPAVAMLSAGFWKREYGSDESVIGRTIQLNDSPVTIVGVMAPGIELPPERGQSFAPHADLWIVRQFDPAGPFHNNHVNPGMARLAPGATLARAQAELDALTKQLPAAFATAYSDEFLKRYRFHTVATPLKQYAVADVAPGLWILFGAVAFVLAIACANVMNLFLVRFESRRREFAIRSALGASWHALAGDALREGLVLSTAGGLVALALGYASVRWLVALAPAGLPRLGDVQLDGGVFAFILALIAIVGAVVALAPVIRLRNANASQALGDGGRTGTVGVERQRLRGALVVSQVALALMLVVGAGLLLKSYRRLRDIDPGFTPQGVLTVSIYPSRQRYDSAQKAWQLYANVLERVRAIPGVSGAGMSDAVPLDGDYGCTVQGFEDQRVYDRLKAANLTTCAGQERTTPGFFAAMGIPILKGRDFTADDNDHPDGGAVIVSKAFADRFWPGEDPIGHGVGPNGRTVPPFSHVVGVVGDVHGDALTDPPAIAIYYPFVPMPAWRAGGYGGPTIMAVHVSKGSTSSYVNAVRRAVLEADRTVPIANEGDMETVVEGSMGRLTFTMTLLGIAGLTSLLLAAIGLYGLIAYVVARRTSEIGVRLALGARPAHVEGLVVRGALRLTLAGLALGAAGSLAFARVLRGLLYGVAPWDPLSYLAAVLVLGTVATLAAWIPARRAAAVDPAVALRSE